jgi:hypothetical protein
VHSDQFPQTFCDASLPALSVHGTSNAGTAGWLPSSSEFRTGKGAVGVPCSLVAIYRRFRGTYCLHHRPDKEALPRNRQILPVYTALQLESQPSSYSPPWEPEASLSIKMRSKSTWRCSLNFCN